MPRKIILTSRHIRFIEKNYLKMSSNEIDRIFGVSQGASKRWMNKHCLKVPKSLSRKFASQKMKSITSSDDRTDFFIFCLFLYVPIKPLADIIGRSDTFIKTRLRQLGLKIPRHIINQRIQDSRIKPGNVPPNKGKKIEEYMDAETIAKVKKTFYKKGNIPANAVGFKNGDISIRTSKTGVKYKYVRLAKSKWYPLHQYLWEQKYGKPPSGHCLWFKDGNSLNTNLSNLEVITRKENYRRNSGHSRLTDNYIAHLIAGRKNKHLVPQLLKNKKLLEVKRQQVLLNRQINDNTTNSQKA